MNYYRSILLIGPLLFAVGCGKKDGNTDNSLTIGEERPSDTTGKTGTVSLGFVTDNTSSAFLADTLQVSETITLSSARFNIARIKIRASKVVTAEESALDTTDVGQEKTDVASLEEQTESSANARGANRDSARVSDRQKGSPMVNETRRTEIGKKKDQFQRHEKDRLDRTCENDKNIRFKGPYIYNAISGAFEESDAPTVVLPDGGYRRIEFQLKRNMSVVDTDPLLGNVFILKGNFNKDGTGIPFEITNHVAMNFRLSGDTAMPVNPDVTTPLKVVFNVADWFTGIDLTNAEVDATGTIFVDQNTNQAILHALKKNIKKATRFGKDANGDGKIPAAETAGKGEEVNDADTPEPAVQA